MKATIAYLGALGHEHRHPRHAIPPLRAAYATAALRYSSIDVMVDRQSGAVLEGDADRPTETTELWTFVRHPNEGWKLSAIQEA